MNQQNGRPWTLFLMILNSFVKTKLTTQMGGLGQSFLMLWIHLWKEKKV